MTPTLYQSDAGDRRLAVRLLGRHVRRRAHDCPRRLGVLTGARAASVATPKSRMTTRPSGVTRTLDGLTSRCSFPAACSASQPLDELRTARTEPFEVTGAPHATGGRAPGAGARRDPGRALASRAASRLDVEDAAN